MTAASAFLLMFGLMFVQYALASINTRMTARGHYLGTAATDACIALFGFTLIRYVASTDLLSAQIGYVLGGVCGGCSGVWLSRSEPRA